MDQIDVFKKEGNVSPVSIWEETVYCWECPICGTINESRDNPITLDELPCSECIYIIKR